MEGSIFLTGENPELARAEVEGALKALGKHMVLENPDERIVMLDGPVPPGLASRLGFSHFTGRTVSITESSIPEILVKLKGMISESPPEKGISMVVKVPAGRFGFSSSDLFTAAEDVIRSEGKRVMHRQPDLKMFIIVRDMTYTGWIDELTVRNSAKLRRGSRMPFNRPVVMDPRLARVLVNLSGLPPDSLILDPFLGPGGLAIEAAHLGHRVIGVEMDREICRGARANVSHQGLSDRIEVQEGDSRKLASYPWARKIGRVDGIITDPPFGRSAGTMGEDPGKLLYKVLEEVNDLMEPGSPLVLDSFSEEIIDNVPGFGLLRKFDIRVHKSMTRHIGLLVKIGEERKKSDRS